MNVFAVLMMAASAAVVFGYICRLDALQFKTHRAPVVFFHIALMVCAASAGVAAYVGDIGVQEVAGLVGSGLWLSISLTSWRNGPPSHVTKPEPIDSHYWPEIAGGKQEE